MLVLVLLVLERNEALELFKIEAAAQEGPIVRKAVRPQRISGSSFDFKVEPRAPLYILPTDFSFNT
jgi:hypothetical protein